MSRNLSQIYVMYEIDRNYFKMRMYKRNKTKSYEMEESHVCNCFSISKDIFCGTCWKRYTKVEQINYHTVCYIDKHPVGE